MNGGAAAPALPGPWGQVDSLLADAGRSVELARALVGDVDGMRWRVRTARAVLDVVEQALDETSPCARAAT